MCSVMLAFSSNLNEQHAALGRDCAVSVDFSWKQLSYIWLTLATYQRFSWLNRKATRQLNVKERGRHTGGRQTVTDNGWKTYR